MKIHRYLIVSCLFCSMTIYGFSETKDNSREARKLRAEAAYLEMKGEIEKAAEAYEKSMQYLADPAIEAKLEDLKNRLQPSISKVDLPETHPTVDPSQNESDSTPQPQVAQGIQDNPLTSPDASILKAHPLGDEYLQGKPLPELKIVFESEFSSVTDDEAAYDLLGELAYRMNHAVWDDVEAGLLLVRTYLDKFPGSPHASEVQMRYAGAATWFYDWTPALDAAKAAVGTALEANEEYDQLKSLQQVLHYQLLKGDWDACMSTVEEFDKLDPRGRWEQSYQAHYVLSNLRFLQQRSIIDAQSIIMDSSKPDARELYRLLIEWFYYVNDSDDFWNLEDGAQIQMQQFGSSIARYMINNCPAGFYQAQALQYLINQGDETITDADRLQYRESFVRNYWFDPKADSVRSELIDSLQAAGDPVKAAEYREFLIWDDIDSIDTKVDEYYRAIEIAKAWESAEQWQKSKLWYERALELDQYGEWSKTKDVEAALAAIREKLPPEPEVQLSELGLEEQEALASEILGRLVDTPEDQVREFEKGYLEIINRCPDAPQVDVAYWRIGRLYRLAYNQPKNDKLIPLYEQFLQKYPESEGVPAIVNTLTVCLAEVENWERLVQIEFEYLLKNLSSDPSDNEIAIYGLHADHLMKLGKTEAAARWYKRVLVSDTDGHTFTAEFARDTLAGMGFTTPEAIAGIIPAEAYP